MKIRRAASGLFVIFGLAGAGPNGGQVLHDGQYELLVDGENGLISMYSLKPEEKLVLPQTLSITLFQDPYFGQTVELKPVTPQYDPYPKYVGSLSADLSFRNESRAGFEMQVGLPTSTGAVKETG